ncbi:Long-chain-fatty-acid--CoA ligase 1 [Clonorchis sinensis]|uniref:long-chain-fatty-acid--CoA ligase n=1 Tax=Clonorchis sinensis TaxID=79923 RepID=A0A8T1M461_CLOSI|nr:Long-chain-fatty-acid--CoA ligase 1 [Clonorchis sinensis]
MDEEDRRKLMKKAKDSVAIFTFAELLEPNPDDLFLVCYTSGSTGLPKGVMYTHRTFLKAVSVTLRLYEFAEISVVGNLHVSFLPLAHIFEQLATAACLMYGSQIAFLTADFTRLLDDYAYYRPTVLALVPRVLSRMYAVVMEKVNTSKIKARLFERAIKSKLEEQKRGIFKQCGILDSLCFRPIRNRVGGRVKVIVCASAPLQPEVFQFAKSAFSCPVIEAYGSTESGGLITMTVPTDVTGGHAGSVAIDMKIKLIDVSSMGLTVKRDGIGEICVISPANTPGYYKESEKTKELFDEDGFIRMGDIGRWTECGTLQIVDRCKNIFKLSQGEYVAPEKVEQVYALSPLVLNVYVDGNSLYSYTVAVVVPNFERLEKQFPEFFDELLRENNGVGSDSKKYFAEACRQKKLAKLILNELNKLGAEKGLKGFEQVRDLHLSSEPFSIENGLLTPTMKIARPQVRKHFAAQIQALYEADHS